MVICRWCNLNIGGWKLIESDPENWNFTAVKPEWDFELPTGVEEAKIRAGVATAFHMRIWTTSPLMIYSQPITGFNLKKGTIDNDDEIVCSQSNEYELVSGLNTGVVITDNVIPEGFHIIGSGGQTIVGGVSFGSYNSVKIDGESHSTCKGLCHGCMADYRESSDDMIYYAGKQGAIAFIPNDPDEAAFRSRYAWVRFLIIFFSALGSIVVLTATVLIGMSYHPATKDKVSAWKDNLKPSCCKCCVKSSTTTATTTSTNKQYPSNPSANQDIKRNPPLSNNHISSFNRTAPKSATAPIPPHNRYPTTRAPSTYTKTVQASHRIPPMIPKNSVQAQVTTTTSSSSRAKPPAFQKPSGPSGGRVGAPPVPRKATPSSIVRAPSNTGSGRLGKINIPAAFHQK
jgi:hypothetical protein